MTNKEILSAALRQSAIEANCCAEDFLKRENVVALSAQNENARKYYELPLYCNLISYGSNVVASVNAGFAGEARAYIDKYGSAHCFETPNLHVLSDALQKHGMRVCFMAEYFLPDVNALRELPCGYTLKVLTPDDFGGFYTEQWSNALCEKRKHLDVLAVGAYDGDALIGLAGCSADCDSMWQIGVDVLPLHRRQGVAAALTSRLALEILKRGKVPFYCAAWSNLSSVRNAIKSGFKPAWVEMTAKSIEFVEKMNK